MNFTSNAQALARIAELKAAGKIQTGTVARGPGGEEFSIYCRRTMGGWEYIVDDQAERKV
jgi:hypothetical protein